MPSARLVDRRAKAVSAIGTDLIKAERIDEGAAYEPDTPQNRVEWLGRRERRDRPGGGLARAAVRQDDASADIGENSDIGLPAMGSRPGTIPEGRRPRGSGPAGDTG